MFWHFNVDWMWSESSINQREAFEWTETVKLAKLSYFTCMDFDSPREAVLSVLHSTRWQLFVCQTNAENTDQYGYYYNHRPAIHGVIAVEEKSNLVGCLHSFFIFDQSVIRFFFQTPRDGLNARLSSQSSPWRMRIRNRIRARMPSAVLLCSQFFSFNAAKRAHFHAHRHAQKANLVHT